jgi:predicted hydrocarbon binding protein
MNGKLKPVKYIQFDEEKGALYSGKIRSLIIPIGFLKMLKTTFGELVGEEGCEILLYKIGEALGKEFARILKSILEGEKMDREEIKLSEETLIQEVLNAIFLSSGFGKIKILGIDLEKDFLEVEMCFTPSFELGETQYCFEEGLISGVYKEITKKEVFCEVKEEKENKIILRVSKEVPEEFKEKEKLVLLTRKDLEEKIKETTQALQQKIQELEETREKEMVLRIRERAKTRDIEKKMEELEKFQRLTIGREIKMVELKKQIKKLEEELMKYRK